MILQSATSISDYKLCPTSYYFRHVLRLRPIEEPESARQGTNWHKCLEILTDPQGGRDAMIEHLNQTYANCPPSIELTDWEVERTILLYSALGWLWYWSEDQIETIAREVHFKRQINEHYGRQGKIDRIIQLVGRFLLGEYKSTGKPIDSGSIYWDHLKLDSQLTLYLIEARHAQLAGKLEQYGISATDPLISGMLYDVWRKPTIRPKKLTQAESKRFAESGPVGDYCGETFEISGKLDIYINGVRAEVTPGKTPGTFAIRETPEMFGARLLADIREQPEKYFARREIARTDQELKRADEEYTNIARLTYVTEQRKLWFRNEHQCIQKWRCVFTPICLYDIDVSNGRVPEGFRCLNKDKKNAEKTPKSTPKTGVAERSTTGTD